MSEKLYMKILVEFSDGIYYEVEGEGLNPKQIEIISNILEIPKMKEAVVAY